MRAEISRYTESQLTETFTQWNENIQQHASQEKIRDILLVLMSYAVLAFFQNDFDNIWNTLSIVNNFLNNRHHDVVRAACQVLKWITKSLNVGGLLFKDPINNAFTWIEEHKSKLQFNALCILKFGMRFTKTEMLHNYKDHFQNIFSFSLSEDSELSNCACSVIRFYVENNDLSREVFDLCAAVVNSKNDSTIIGPLKILTSLVNLNRDLLKNQADLLLRIRHLAYTAGDDVSLIASRMLSMCAKHNIKRATPEQCQQTFNMISARVLKNNMFFSALDDFLEANSYNIPASMVYDFLQKALSFTSSKECYFYSFSILRFFPDLDIPGALFSKCQPNDNMVKYLPKAIPDSVLANLQTFAFKNLGFTSNILTSLAIFKKYWRDIFKTKEEFYTVLKQFNQTTNEKLKIALLDAYAELDLEEVQEYLVNLALYDYSKNVRRKALESITPTPSVAFHQELDQCCFDSSYKVRREGIKLLSKLQVFNPFVFTPTISFLIDGIYDAISSTVDIKVAMKNASLLPYIVTYFKDVSYRRTTKILTICLLCLDYGHYQKYQFIEKDNYYLTNSFISTILYKSPEEPKRVHVFIATNIKYIDRRDCFFLDTIAAFGSRIKMYLNYILDAILVLFQANRSSRLIESAANCLLTISGSIEGGLNLLHEAPEIVTSVIQCLYSNPPPSLGKMLMKLLGATCDRIPFENSSKLEDKINVELENPAFYTEYVISLLQPLSKSPTIALCDAISRIFIGDPQHTTKYIVDIIDSITKTIDIVGEAQRDDLFNMLSCLVSVHPVTIPSTFPQIIQILDKYNYNPKCLDLGTSLCYYLDHSFSFYISKMYRDVLLYPLSNDTAFVHSKLQFLSAAIIYQRQQFELFLVIVESHYSKLSESIKEQYAEAISMLVNALPLEQYKARINRIFNQINPKEFTFVPPRLPPIKADGGLFQKVEIPTEVTIDKWIDMVAHEVVIKSPIPVIQACYQIIDVSKETRDKLFPVAFLSCWIIASEQAKRHLSNIFMFVLHTFKAIPPLFFVTIEVLDRAQMPLYVLDSEISKASKSSRPLALFYTQRIFTQNPDDPETIERLLELNASMGNYSIARGILKHASLPPEKAAKWYESLKEWDKALEIYKYTPNSVDHLVRCYAHLERWESIAALEEQSEKLPKPDQTRIAKYFAWAFLQLGDYDKVDKYMGKFHEQMNLPELYFCAYSLARRSMKKEAQFYLNQAVDQLLIESKAFKSGDETRIHKILNFAQIIVEIQEVLDGKIENLWSKRLANFNRDSDAWRRVIKVRSLIESQDIPNVAYIKMLSTLRKERQWGLIDSYFDRMLSKTLDIRVEYAKSKVFWARSLQKKSVNLLRRLIKIIEIHDTQSFIQAMQGLNKCKKATLLDQVEPALGGITEKAAHFDELVQSNPNEVRNKLRYLFIRDSTLNNKIYRKKAEYLLVYDKDSPEILDSLKHALNEGQDHKTWRIWAYANANSSDDARLVASAKGFLKTLQLNPSPESICQLFSVLFRIKNDSLIEDDFLNEILTLSDTTLLSGISQISIQIEHQSPKLRSFVKSILIRLGHNHYQMLYYPLKIYEFTKKNINILKEISVEHPDEHFDLEQLNEGLLRAAFTWFEECLLGFDAALRMHSNLQDEQAIATLRKLFKKFETPRCDVDRLFIKVNDLAIKQIKQAIETDDKSVWMKLRSFRKVMDERVSKLEVLLLHKICPELASRTSFCIAIPGMYKPDAPFPKLHSLDPSMKLLNTQQHPRNVVMLSETGQRYKFLLKGNEDLRLDERLMQCFELINSLLKGYNKTRMKELQITKYVVVPLSNSVGLIEWVNHSKTLHQIIVETRHLLHTSQTVEIETIQGLTDIDYDYLNDLQKLEIFKEVEKVYPANELRENLWITASNAPVWLYRRETFTKTTALMSFVGYIIGLGDRHPSNIMTQKKTGKVFHIDFGDSFERAVFRANFPEKVPFRLTRIITNAFDSVGVDGTFRTTSENVMYVLRKNKTTIVSQLAIFAHEPLSDTDHFLKVASNDPNWFLERVSQKLDGKDAKFVGEIDHEMGIEEQVDRLIGIATDKERYATHYTGWCPFW